MNGPSMPAIGLPAYQDYSRNSKRSDAHASLTQIAQKQERFFSDNSRYATTITQLGYTANPSTSTGGYWQLSIVAATTSQYTVQAVPLAPHSDGDCTAITLTSAGARGSTPGATDCWSGR